MQLIIYTHKPLNNITSLTARKNLQANGAYITALIITLHRYPYELHKNTHSTHTANGMQWDSIQQKDILASKYLLNEWMTTTMDITLRC
jgi:hypothetical protein